MRRVVQNLLLALVVGYSISTQAAAQQAAAPAAAAPAAADPTAPVSQAVVEYFETFNAHDGQKLAEKWSPGGVHVDRQTGKKTSGREALQKDFTALFAESPNSHLVGSVEEARMIGADAALVDGVSVVYIDGAEPAMTAFSAILVKQDGKWLFDRVYESPVSAPETPREALEPLAWMVGSWQDETEGAEVTTRTRWSPGEAFLVRSYSVAREGEEPFAGTQVIGWDPAAKQIRSWTFNSDGSFGEGTWSKNGADWVVRAVQTLADGQAASATQVITMVDGDTATVQMIAKEVGGVPEPANDPVTMKRVADAEESAAVQGESTAVEVTEVTR